MQLSGRRAVWTSATLFVIVCAAALTGYFFWRIEPLPFTLRAPPYAEIDRPGVAAVRFTGGVFVTTVAAFRDELFAYLMYQHYRAAANFAKDELLLCYIHDNDERPYRVFLVLTNDLIGSVNRAVELHAARGIETSDWKLISDGSLTAYRKQTRLFVSAYNLPVKRKMEHLSKAELRSLVRRFIRYKSTTDPRIRKRIEPLPSVLSSSDAQRLAGDIIEVAAFYDLPLDFFLGIGAMENNYMNVRGDLQHTIWKRRPAKDDIVLERRKGRVRVLNDSAGVWQITRETLRLSHQLYLKDERDYSQLAEHLRPPQQFNMTEVSPDVLTTYAGLLLRYLLDRFDGDVALAVGAYNGGPGNPNLRYHQGVESAASHARKILEQAAALNGATVAHMPWLTSP